MIAKDIRDEVETDEDDFRWRLEVTAFSFLLWYTNWVDFFGSISIFTNLPFHPRYIYVFRVNKWCLVKQWYHSRCLLHSWPHIVTLWATIATHLGAKIAENGWKLVFDNTYHHNLLFYIQVCSMGQQVVFNYPIVSPKVPITLVTQNDYPIGLHSHSFWATWPKMVENRFLMMLSSLTSYFIHKYVLWANKWC
jgi:hypothetical protein